MWELSRQLSGTSKQLIYMDLRFLYKHGFISSPFLMDCSGSDIYPSNKSASNFNPLSREVNAGNGLFWDVLQNFKNCFQPTRKCHVFVNFKGWGSHNTGDYLNIVEQAGKNFRMMYSFPRLMVLWEPCPRLQKHQCHKFNSNLGLNYKLFFLMQD